MYIYVYHVVRMYCNCFLSFVQAVESLEKEMRILQKIQHTYIVQYYGTERSDTCVRIFMEFMEGVSDCVISTVLNVV